MVQNILGRQDYLKREDSQTNCKISAKISTDTLVNDQIQFSSPKLANNNPVNLSSKAENTH